MTIGKARSPAITPGLRTTTAALPCSFGADDGERRPIVKAIEIFANREPHDLAEIVFDRGGPVELGEVFGHAAYQFVDS